MGLLLPLGSMDWLMICPGESLWNLFIDFNLKIFFRWGNFVYLSFWAKDRAEKSGVVR